MPEEIYCEPSMPTELAVSMRNVYKSYGFRKNKLQVLKNLNVNVPKGSTYGLLGPSGSGKTTLLKCIVGRLRVDHGDVLVLGKPPGSAGHKIPGKMVGYMPQEVALFNEFTIKETLMFFGLIHNMSFADIQERTTFLIEFLDLPCNNQLISTLSGGQKRRVSFAAALLQEPELVILDEPTVGVDPILREKIWDHMIKIVQTSNTTIIITTHYIEEAQKANRVGLIRNGHLLEEQSPRDLMAKFSLTSLEDVFLKLCQQDQISDTNEEVNELPCISDRMKNSSQGPSNPSPSETTPLLENGNRLWEPTVSTKEPMSCHFWQCCSLPSGWNILSLAFKNLTVMKRQIGFLFFEFILPSIQIILFCLCIGKDPFNLPVAIVNNDQFYLGRSFISFLDNNTISKYYYNNLERGLDSVRTGERWGVILIERNYTTDLILRFQQGINATDDILDGSTIKLYFDSTNQEITAILERKILEAFQRFAAVTLSSVGYNPDVANIPVKLEQVIYGEKNPSITNFMAPGIILSITFFMATGLTTLAFVLERKEGLLERSLVAGVTGFELMIGHMLAQLLVLIVQVTLMLVFAIFVFKVPYKGPFIWVILLVLLQGLCGMNLGMLFSAVCDKEVSAIQLALGSVYPSLLLSGIIWPIEAIPTGLQYVSKSLPLTYASEALRSVLSRGWGITYMLVWRGYLVTIGWCVGLLLVATIFLRIKQ